MPGRMATTFKMAAIGIPDHKPRSPLGLDAFVPKRLNSMCGRFEEGGAGVFTIGRRESQTDTSEVDQGAEGVALAAALADVIP